MLLPVCPEPNRAICRRIHAKLYGTYNESESVARRAEERDFSRPCRIRKIRLQRRFSSRISSSSSGSVTPFLNV